MATLIMILGILMVIFGALCAFTPLATLTAAGFFIAAVLIVSGVMGIISGIRYRFYGLNFVVSLLALALGVLYAEGSRRYLESLSTYTRRRMTQASRAQVDEVRYVPAALALHQRPAVPGIRSTFGTGTELLNSIRLILLNFKIKLHITAPSLSYLG